ncbi:LysR family transcriptional regulator [Xylophilus sp.]|uniref:LysR family transcriptional regulator n=1 Tax=Xylophilus sp. TaxID=2653893 RepID=UPI0013B5FC64|nr:LysR family transcriptional regulator [Xylophilus sp.]KAF1048556.1 MAG: HTH-type transcriptional regulator PgrR [Xylophilus sp.]
MDLNAVRILVRVAEARSFTQAAAALGLTQSGLSRAVARLEAELGVRLLHRSTRSVRLTPDGEAFHTRGAPLLAELEEAGRMLQDRRAEPAGPLRITAPSAFGRVVLLPLLGALTERHPALRVETVLSDRLLDLVEDGFDAAVRTGPVQDARIVARRLAPLAWATVAAPAYLARSGGAPRTVEDLRRHNCLTVRTPQTGRTKPWEFLDAAGRPQDVEVAGNLVFDLGDALVDGALGGWGIAQVMEFAVRDALADGRLVRLLEPFAGRSRELSLLYPRSRQCSPRVAALAQALAQGGWQ